MKYHALFDIFEKAAKFEISSAANYRGRFVGLWSRLCCSLQYKVLRIVNFSATIIFMKIFPESQCEKNR